MAVVLKTFAKGIRVEPNLADPASPTSGMIYYNSTDNRLKAYVAGASRVVTTNDLADTLTNKTIDAPANTITNIANTNIAAGAGIVYSKLNLADSIVNADINTAAAIAYSKLNLADSIVNADVNSSAAIAYSKLANLAGYSVLGVTGATAASGAAITAGAENLVLARGSSGVEFQTVVNAMIDSDADIARTKLAAGTPSTVVINDATGVMSETAALTDGQLLIGSTGNAPQIAALTGTANQISITNGAGSVTLSTPQDISTTSDVNFKSITSTDATEASFILAKTGTNSSNVAINNEGSVIGTTITNLTAQPFKLLQGATSKLELDATGNLTLKENLLSEKAWLAVSANDAALYVNDTASLPTTFIKRITNNSATNIVGITAPASNSQFFILTNAKGNGNNFTIENESATATAANRVITGNGLDLRLAGGASAWLYYDTSSSRWRVVGGSGGGGKVVTGSMGSPIQVEAADTIATTAGSDEEIYVESDGGRVELTSNPQLAAGTVDGETKLIIGTSNTDYIVLVDGNGLKLNGDWQSLLDHTLTLRWNGTIWVDKGRSNI